MKKSIKWDILVFVPSITANKEKMMQKLDKILLYCMHYALSKIIYKSKATFNSKRPCSMFNVTSNSNYNTISSMQNIFQSFKCAFVITEHMTEMSRLLLLGTLLFTLPCCLSQSASDKCCASRTVLGNSVKVTSFYWRNFFVDIFQSGTYNLKDENDTRCPDGCLYSKGDLNVCFRYKNGITRT